MSSTNVHYKRSLPFKPREQHPFLLTFNPARIGCEPTIESLAPVVDTVLAQHGVRLLIVPDPAGVCSDISPRARFKQVLGGKTVCVRNSAPSGGVVIGKKAEAAGLILYDEPFAIIRFGSGRITMFRCGVESLLSKEFIMERRQEHSRHRSIVNAVMDGGKANVEFRRALATVYVPRTYRPDLSSSDYLARVREHLVQHKLGFSLIDEGRSFDTGLLVAEMFRRRGIPAPSTTVKYVSFPTPAFFAVCGF